MGILMSSTGLIGPYMGILMSSIGLIDVLCLEYFLLYEVHISNYLISFSYEEYVHASVIYNQYALQEI